MGEASYVIGIEIHRDRTRKILGLSQKAYIENVLERFGMKHYSSIAAPIVKGEKFSLDQCPKNGLKRKEMDRIPYASLVGSHMYVQVCTRPNIAFTVGMLGRYQNNPGKNHGKATKRVLRYLQGTKDYKLIYKQSDYLEVLGYSNSDFAGCVDSSKSTSEYIFLLTGEAVSWRSIKQTIVASSTTEAEFIACYETTLQGLWLKNFISGLQVTIENLL
ncbi:secreted RxLR effector protein 161-like [Coffea arabica]|uniref:Secreted RxLR effector protein 161-like n=1 Tax=Coffea arabica TaxID=13443 RepID=A0ABM4U121_COFAR